MSATYFQDFKRDNGLPVTVEYSASGGEPDFDHPGHICDGGGSGPEIVILKAWPNTPWHNRLAGLEMKIWLARARFGFMALPLRRALNILMRLDEWWRASLTDAECQRFEVYLAENYLEEPYEPEYLYG